MNAPTKMSRVVKGKRYDVSKATLIAHNVYWDGHNFERSGRNSFLYRTKKGNFFVVHLTQWQGERDTLDPLSEQEAMDLYERLQEHPVEYEEAFDVEIEDA